MTMAQIDNRAIAEISAGAIPFGLAAARHMPAPVEGSVIYGWIFDTIQDLAKNNDRIGMRRAKTPVLITSDPPSVP